jgi:hypothetical protein
MDRTTAPRSADDALLAACAASKFVVESDLLVCGVTNVSPMIFSPSGSPSQACRISPPCPRPGYWPVSGPVTNPSADIEMSASTIAIASS